MVKISPQQEAEYALKFGVSRDKLPAEAQLAYDHLTEQRLRAGFPTSRSQSDAGAPRSREAASKWTAILASALLFPLGPGIGAVLIPWAITHWREAAPYPVALRAIGVALIVSGGLVLVVGWARFASEGMGIPLPLEPTSRYLTVGGPYRYVRNPLYLAWVAAIVGQAVLLGKPVLLIYAAGVATATVAFVHWVEEPTLAKRFGAQYEAYRKQVPGWWPRLPRRTP
ncbi:MAG: isoprenylcysteine carboxylmethyltransferase family protein [Candidatus Dormiibacterota bacterium]